MVTPMTFCLLEMVTKWEGDRHTTMTPSKTVAITVLTQNDTLTKNDNNQNHYLFLKMFVCDVLSQRCVFFNTKERSVNFSSTKTYQERRMFFSARSEKDENSFVKWLHESEGKSETWLIPIIDEEVLSNADLKSLCSYSHQSSDTSPSSKHRMNYTQSHNFRHKGCTLKYFEGEKEDPTQNGCSIIPMGHEGVGIDSLVKSFTGGGELSNRKECVEHKLSSPTPIHKDTQREKYYTSVAYDKFCTK